MAIAGIIPLNFADTIIIVINSKKEPAHVFGLMYYLKIIDKKYIGTYYKFCGLRERFIKKIRKSIVNYIFSIVSRS